MAKRRRPSNLLALIVLATLLEQPRHPYEIASVLRERGKDQDVEIKWGSLYTVVGSLQRYGLIDEVVSHRQGRRPERTVYRITEAGSRELTGWLRELVAVPRREFPRFKAALSVLAVLPPAEAAALLARRLDQLEAENTQCREDLAKHSERIPRIFVIETEYELAVRTAEARWLRSLLTEIAEGTLPGLDLWHGFHQDSPDPPASQASQAFPASRDAAEPSKEAPPDT